MLVPRFNNLMSDLVYLKKTDYDKYQEILSSLNDRLNLESLWTLTEELAPIFQANQDRPRMRIRNAIDRMNDIANNGLKDRKIVLVVIFY